MRFGRSRSSKVIDFGSNRKRLCDFLLVHHSNLGPILHRFRDIAGFLLMTSPLFHPNFGGVSVGPDRRCWGSMWAATLSYYSAIKNYFWSIPTHVITVPERHRQTDGQTTYCNSFATSRYQMASQHSDILPKDSANMSFWHFKNFEEQKPIGNIVWQSFDRFKDGGQSW